MRWYCTIHEVVNMENAQKNNNRKSEMWKVSSSIVFVGFSFRWHFILLWFEILGTEVRQWFLHTPGTQSLLQTIN
jgi:hypothetical protein